jgi:transcriptional regulator with XRE-family HTH domain
MSVLTHKEVYVDVSIGARIKAARTAAGMTQMDVARGTDLSLQAVGDIEREIVRDPHISSLRQIAYALGVPVEMLVKEEMAVLASPLGDAPPPPGPSERSALSDEWRRRLLAPIAPAAIALNAQFAPKVDANAFTIEEYEQVGEAFTRLGRLMADAVSSEYIHSEEASEAVLADFNRVGSFHAGGPMYELQRTLQRAYEELVRRGKTGVPSLEELWRGVA